MTTKISYGEQTGLSYSDEYELTFRVRFRTKRGDQYRTLNHEIIPALKKHTEIRVVGEVTLVGDLAT